MAALTIDLNSICDISRSQFRQIANDNPETYYQDLYSILSFYGASLVIDRNPKSKIQNPKSLDSPISSC